MGHAVRDGRQGGEDEETTAGTAAVTPVAPRHRDLDLDLLYLLDLLDLDLGRVGLELRRRTRGSRSRRTWRATERVTT